MFTTPVPATAQGNLGRNALRGFGAVQSDITFRRQFRLTEKLGLQSRADFFNILNYPNFAAVRLRRPNAGFNPCTKSAACAPSNWRSSAQAAVLTS